MLLNPLHSGRANNHSMNFGSVRKPSWELEYRKKYVTDGDETWHPNHLFHVASDMIPETGLSCHTEGGKKKFWRNIDVIELSIWKLKQNQIGIVLGIYRKYIWPDILHLNKNTGN